MQNHNNLSWLDGILRIMGAAIFGAICGINGWYIGVLAVYPLVTGLGGWCPLYAAMGVSTALPDPDAKDASETGKTDVMHSHKEAA